MIYSEPAPEVAARPAPLTAATLRSVGLRRAARPARSARRTTTTPSGRRCCDTRHPRGWYSRLGPVDPLVERDDDAVAIFGPGEDVLLEFAAPDGAAAGGLDPPGRARRQGLVQGHGPLHQGRRDGGAVARGRLGGAARAPCARSTRATRADDERPGPSHAGRPGAALAAPARCMPAHRTADGHRRLPRRRVGGRSGHRRQLPGLRLPVDGARPPGRGPGRSSCPSWSSRRRTRWPPAPIPTGAPPASATCWPRWRRWSWSAAWR